jgi:membrane protease YdiL (CAAX protease family)
LFLDGVLLQVMSLTANRLVLHGNLHNVHDLTKAGIASLFPVGLVMALVCWQLAKAKGGKPREVLSLRTAGLGVGGTLMIVLAFIIGLYLALIFFVLIAGIDVAQYTPGPHGESPSTGSAGQVKEAMFDFANNPALFLLAIPSVAIGAPLAEELIFRGQIFTALARSRIGFTGATLATSVAWALMHFTEPWLAIGQIFVMGLVLGYLLYRFGSLWLTMLCHGAWNLVFSLVIFGMYR